MAESNLPPGVATRDLPGNSSKDMAWEKLWENWVDEFVLLGDDLIKIARDWETEFDKVSSVSKKKLEKILGELDVVISEMDRCAELIPSEEDLEPEEPEYDPCP